MEPEPLTSTDLESSTKVPYVIKDKVLMTSGIWNNYYYSDDDISTAFKNTNWGDKAIRSLFLDHEDLRSSEWIGEVINPKLVNNILLGDLVVVDKPTAMKLAYGAKMGISPKVHGQEEGNVMHDFVFDNFSVVINPAVKTAYINNQQNTEDAKMADEVKKIEPAVENKEAPVPQVEAPVPEKKKVPEVEPTPEVEMAESDMIDQIIKLASALKIKKEQYPAPDTNKEAPKEEAKPEDKTKYPSPYPEEMNSKIAEEVSKQMQILIANKDASIKELSSKLETVEQKLNEPAKEPTVQSQELSENPFVLNKSASEADFGMLNFLRSMRN